MGHQLVWNDQYNIGIKSIDKEHEKLFHILNRLFESGQQEKKSRWVCREAVKYFKDHALQHFRNEEDYMISVHYTGYNMHKRIHDNFRERMLPALERELELTNYSAHAVDHFLSVCAGWLIGHTLSEDQAIGTGKQLCQWEHLLPEEEQAVMGQTVINRLHSMFQLDSRLISSCYGGEKFGDGIYYCMTTGDLLINEDGISVLTENAIIELEKHFKQNQTGKITVSGKKKILVVDDFDFMLIAMRQILGGDYEVMTATSGLSAFRSITLDPPDLVLLDYEMPVCNGSQVLEMIRSEKGFADIPVIFLTGRVDKESVEKVLELKPQGYLSKALSPEQVKTEIMR